MRRLLMMQHFPVPAKVRTAFRALVGSDAVLVPQMSTEVAALLERAVALGAREGLLA